MNKFIKWLFIVPAWVLYHVYLYTHFIAWGVSMAFMVVFFCIVMAFANDERVERLDKKLYDFALVWESKFTDDIDDINSMRPFKAFPYERYMNF